MSTRGQLQEGYEASGLKVESHPDATTGTPACLLRHWVGSRLVVTVGGDVEPRYVVGAPIDALALAEAKGASSLTLRLGRRHDSWEKDLHFAVSTILDCHRGSIEVTLETEGEPLDFGSVSAPPDRRTHRWGQDDARLDNWNTLLSEWYALTPTGLALDFMEEVGLASVRLYPQLTSSTSNPEWSVRLDGLQVGKVGKECGWLRVGTKVSKKDPVKSWLAIAGTGERIPFSSAGEACRLVSRFRGRFGTVAGGIADHGQPEHSLESAVLRGLVQVETEGRPLRVPYADQASHQYVAWGSQFPTLWWPGGRARYLDALLRDGRTPWAIEMKVPHRAGGYGHYLNQGLTQAVLYRQFIRAAAPLNPWFDALGMDRESCEAAILLPEPSAVSAAKAQPRIDAVGALSSAFGVAVHTVSTPGLH